MRPFLAILGVAAVLVVGVMLALGETGDDRVPERPESAPLEASVGAIVTVPQRWARKAVRVTGTAVPVNREFLVLRGQDAAIVVQPDPTTRTAGVERGERVTVVGVVTRFDRLQARELERLSGSGRYPALTAAATEVGDVFVSAERVEA